MNFLTAAYNCTDYFDSTYRVRDEQLIHARGPVRQPTEFICWLTLKWRGKQNRFALAAMHAGWKSHLHPINENTDGQHRQGKHLFHQSCSSLGWAEAVSGIMSRCCHVMLSAKSGRYPPLLRRGSLVEREVEMGVGERAGEDGKSEKAGFPFPTLPAGFCCTLVQPPKTQETQDKPDKR